MGKTRIILQAVAALVVVWTVVSFVRAAAASKRITAEKIRTEILAADLADASEGLPAGADVSARAEEIDRIAELFNRLDFAERERAREARIGEVFFEKLTPAERERFIGLTIEKSMQSLVRALDAMSAQERRAIVERGLREIEDGRTEEEMRRAQALSEDLLERVAEHGLNAYFQEAGADTKLDLAPLMEAMDALVKGLRGNEFGPPQP